MRTGLSIVQSAGDCQKIAVLRKIPKDLSKSLTASTGLTDRAEQNPFHIRGSPPNRVHSGQFSTITRIQSPSPRLFPCPRPLPMPYNPLNEHGSFPDQDHHQR
ncbi:hypothetical protein, partial [Paenirhodobacter populi]|uniref:hypothetical protein n=1 Tax=Paenirhodobacter populi TaxID=2306993 RepID=UPI003614A35A